MRFRPKKNKSDAELLELFLQNEDMEVLGQLYERYLEMVYGVCLKYLSHPADAEDAAMAIFEQLSVKIKKQAIQDFRPWLYVVSKNHCLMQLRKKKNTQAVEPERMQSDDLVHPFSESEKEKQERQFEQLERCLETLNRQQKHCVELFYLQGQSYKTIAEQLEWPLGKVRSRIQNGRRNLKICMEALIEEKDEK